MNRTLVICNDEGLKTVISTNETTQNGTSATAAQESSKNHLTVECDNSLLVGSSESLGTIHILRKHNLGLF